MNSLEKALKKRVGFYPYCGGIPKLKSYDCENEFYDYVDDENEEIQDNIVNQEIMEENEYQSENDDDHEDTEKADDSQIVTL